MLVIVSYISYTKIMNAVKIILYTTEVGKQPFVGWQAKLGAKVKSIVAIRIARVRGGNFGDCTHIIVPTLRVVRAYGSCALIMGLGIEFTMAKRDRLL